MVIVWGSRLMGKCDVVPGMFHVATKFGHLWYLPLIPTGSYVVLGEDRGVLVSMSFKSIVLAWARAFLLISAFASTLMAIMLMADGKKHEPWIGSAMTATVTWALLIVICYAPFVTRASFKRAIQLAQELGLNQQGFAAIEQIYGQSTGRSVPLSKPAAAAPARATGSASSPSRRPVPVDDGGAIPLEPPTPKAAPKPVAKPIAKPPVAKPAAKRPNPPGKIGL